MVPFLLPPLFYTYAHSSYVEGERDGIRGFMWFREYKDYPIDAPLKKEQVEPGRGITGCEMHERNGWQDHIHVYKPKKKGLISRMLDHWFGRSSRS